jgi:tetrahydromethanopterin S-methyltransferase subunit G
MAKDAAREEKCAWCYRPLPLRPGPGRPRTFCSRSHRQRAYEARRRADALMVPPGQVVVSEGELRKVHDRIYQLECAIEDVDADLAGRSGVAAHREALVHLLEAARGLVGVVIEPARQ